MRIGTCDTTHVHCGYGAFPGGDPRQFHPDPECSTEAERAAWAEDCARWERGEASADRPPTYTCLLGHATSYGFGTYELECDGEECAGLP